MDKANREAARRAANMRGKVADKRRIRVSKPVPGILGDPVSPDTQGTIYRSMVRTPEVGEAILMPGLNSTKIGDCVLTGTLKGVKIMTLTLEERATCPRSCVHWTTCYGNHSHRAVRWKHGTALEDALRWDVCDRIREYGALLVRLHMLGDFYSYRYLCMWADLLDEFETLSIFGFTAWPPGTRIGDGVATLRGVYPSRFAMRHSGQLGPWGSATIDFPTEKKRIGDAIVCPEQLDANRDKPRGVHCGSCAACWETSRSVIFIEHGYNPRKEQP
jgi:hypothetical protein